jgi:hypothetical protein
MTTTTRSPARRIIGGVLMLVAVQAAMFAASRLISRRLAQGDLDDEEVRRLALMNGLDLSLTSQSLRRARIDLGMGGVNLDLTQAQLDPEGARVEVYGAMGGLNVRVPDEWQVTAEADNRTVGLNVGESVMEAEPEAPHLHLVSHAHMSGVNVERT